MRRVLEGFEPILMVTHDMDDHGWQFIGTSDSNWTCYHWSGGVRSLTRRPRNVLNPRSKVVTS